MSSNLCVGRPSGALGVSILTEEPADFQSSPPWEDYSSSPELPSPFLKRKRNASGAYIMCFKNVFGVEQTFKDLKICRGRRRCTSGEECMY